MNALTRLAVVAAGPLLAGSAGAQIADEPDAAIEECLREGKVVQREGSLEGITNPVRFKLECDGEERFAVFKYLDEHRPGVTWLEPGRKELGFSDSYKYEVAAYLLDRELGMNMVPVAALRQVRGDEGCLVDWIHNASNEEQLAAKPTGPQVAYLAEQKAIMRLFDALIYNTDRRPENRLIDHDTFKLFLIDHTRAFRHKKELPDSFTFGRARLNKEIWEQLQRLDQKETAALLDELITRKQLKAMFVRRDLILEKIDRERKEYGDAVVFTD